MAFPQKLLNGHEELVLDLRPHWLALVRPTFWLLAACALGTGVGAFVDDVPKAALLLVLALVLAAFAWFCIQVVGWATTNFVLTTDRIITRRGVLSKSGIEIPLERINTVFFNQNIFERMVGAGDLAIESAGERGTEHFSNIRRPVEVQRQIYIEMEDNENRKFDRVAGGRTLSAAEQVEKLHELLVRGAITQAQFEAERARLLGG